ncbi:MAG: hypothetical protein IJU61_03860, partial [Victivallales bacterium]|nr:hypothetical protein [Victivallales bacterium]
STSRSIIASPHTNSLDDARRAVDIKQIVLLRGKQTTKEILTVLLFRKSTVLLLQRIFLMRVVANYGCDALNQAIIPWAVPNRN